MSRRAVLPALAAIALLMTSCTAAGRGAGAPVRIANSSAQECRGHAPETQERAPLHSCGEFTIGLGEQVPATATECLENAIGADGAELVVTAPTDEGDPVVSWFRALPAGGMEIWADFRRDKFAGEASWQYSLCPKAESWWGDSAECTYESFE